MSEPQKLTEIMFKNGTLMSVYGTRAEVLAKIRGALDYWVDVRAFNNVSAAEAGEYTIRISEVYLIGAEREVPSAVSKAVKAVDDLMMLDLSGRSAKDIN